MFAYICIYIHIYICIHTHAYIYIYIYIYPYIYLYIYVFIHTYVCTCMYLYIQVYIHIHIHMHMYEQICRGTDRNSNLWCASDDTRAVCRSVACRDASISLVVSDSISGGSLIADALSTCSRSRFSSSLRSHLLVSCLFCKSSLSICCSR